METFDVAVVGGGPAGATAATDLANEGLSVLLLDRGGRIKPCGGAIPPRLIRDFDIPDHLIVARATSARMVSPRSHKVDMPIDGGYVGMVDREAYDEWLRLRAERAGAERRIGRFVELSRDGNGGSVIHYVPNRSRQGGPALRVRARAIIGADGARSTVARQALPDVAPAPSVFAYHEIVESPAGHAFEFDGARCDVYYQGRLSPDFYAWIFPHGETTSIGTGSAQKGFSLRGAVADLREGAGLDHSRTIRGEGAPIPLRPLRRWDNGRDVVVVGDAAGAVAPASGEGIYYAMVSGRFAAQAVGDFLATDDPRALGLARKRFMSANGRVFWILRMMQYFWYASDGRRERFVSICRDPDVQRLTWQAYMNKKLVRTSPLVHGRIFLKDLAHLFRLVSP